MNLLLHMENIKFRPTNFYIMSLKIDFPARIVVLYFMHSAIIIQQSFLTLKKEMFAEVSIWEVPLRRLTYTERCYVHYSMLKTITVRSLIRCFLLLLPQLCIYRSFLYPTCNTFWPILEIITLMIFGCLLGHSFVQPSAWEDPMLEWIP